MFCKIGQNPPIHYTVCLLREMEAASIGLKASALLCRRVGGWSIPFQFQSIQKLSQLKNVLIEKQWREMEMEFQFTSWIEKEFTPTLQSKHAFEDRYQRSVCTIWEKVGEQTLNLVSEGAEFNWFGKQRETQIPLGINLIRMFTFCVW